MTEQITLRKLMHISVALEMAIPFAESAGENKLLVLTLDKFSESIYDMIHKSSSPNETVAIEQAAELYLKSYRNNFGEISGENAKHLITCVCGFIWRSIRDFSPKAHKVFTPVKKALQAREKQVKLTKEKSDFAKWFSLHITNIGFRAKKVG